MTAKGTFSVPEKSRRLIKEAAKLSRSAKLLAPHDPIQGLSIASMSVEKCLEALALINEPANKE